MIIRTVTEKDAHELLEIYRPYVEDTAITFEYDVPTVEEFSDRIRRISANYPYIAAVENGKIAGYAYAGVFKNRAAYDWSVEVTVYVKKGLHRKGIGAKLYSALEKLIENIQNLLRKLSCQDKLPRLHLMLKVIISHTQIGKVAQLHIGIFLIRNAFDTLYHLIWKLLSRKALSV